jgi:putative transposase
MSRPANPYDNASCESFMKTLQYEEVYAHDYQDRDHLRANIEEFIEHYYNCHRLHSALGYRPPQEFEEAVAPSDNRVATMSFFRHREISLENAATRSGFAWHGFQFHRVPEML